MRGDDNDIADERVAADGDDERDEARDEARELLLLDVAFTVVDDDEAIDEPVDDVTIDNWLYEVELVIERWRGGADDDPILFIWLPAANTANGIGGELFSTVDDDDDNDEEDTEDAAVAVAWLPIFVLNNAEYGEDDEEDDKGGEGVVNGDGDDDDDDDDEPDNDIDKLLPAAIDWYDAGGVEDDGIAMGNNDDGDANGDASCGGNANMDCSVIGSGTLRK
jgi:hypothetical protein